MSVDDGHAVALGRILGQNQNFEASSGLDIVAVGGMQGAIVAPELGLGVVGPGQAMGPVAEGDRKPGAGAMTSF